ncbi:sulfatase [Paenibacillus antri]|uniref:Sulfatase n=1 Tax=Paenibacillus antri TaxID=2582848 RepID=A0A5R9GCL9_9BACL|nr:sulfatase-like hydrolase/transferase [Paenibacillus antri]TLS51830.1 sulfatase [Paenibacillus antri]
MVENAAERLSAPTGRRPNVIVFMTDDQGYGDLSCMGSTEVRTPHIDRLAASGARFTDWYAASAVCSPSRAALLTGRYPGNAGVRSILAGRRQTSGLLPSVPTLSSELKALGYRTAMFGKWHLGVREDCRPERHGFDEAFGFMAGCIDYYSHIFYWGSPGNPLHDLWHNGKEVYEDGEYFTDLVTRRAVEHIRSIVRDDREQPFFLYVAYNAPHYPMHAPRKYTDRFAHLPWDRQIMAAMLSAVDDGVGDIVAELERQGIRDDTCIFYQSDNGPSRESRNWLDGKEDPYYGGSAGQLKGHKFSLYEGGIRVPGIWSWPAVIPAGQTISSPCCAVDVLPTIVGAAGGTAEHLERDGIDLLPLLSRGETLPERDLYWELGGQTAVRRGDWKLVLHGQLEEGAPSADDVHLANVANDPGERSNERDRHPELAAELQAAAERWRAGIETRWEREWAENARMHR